MADPEPTLAAILRRAIEIHEAGWVDTAHRAIQQAAQDLGSEAEAEAWTAYTTTLERVSWWPDRPSGQPRVLALMALREALRQAEGG